MLLLAASAGRNNREGMVSKLSPVGIQVTIQQDPLGIVIRLVGQLTHVVGQQAILHSRVDILTYPYSSWVLILLGSRSLIVTCMV